MDLKLASFYSMLLLREYKTGLALFNMAWRFGTFNTLDECYMHFLIKHRCV